MLVAKFLAHFRAIFRAIFNAIESPPRSVKNVSGCAVFVLYSTLSYSEKKSQQKKEYAVLFAA